MSIKLRSTELSHAEASFLKWQYGFDDGDEPFERALWQALVRARFRSMIRVAIRFISDLVK